jgi:hypothetical protein
MPKSKTVQTCCCQPCDPDNCCCGPQCACPPAKTKKG